MKVHTINIMMKDGPFEISVFLVHLAIILAWSVINQDLEIIVQDAMI